jgi:hypothetical protein
MASWDFGGSGKGFLIDSPRITGEIRIKTKKQKNKTKKKKTKKQKNKKTKK